MQSILEKSFLIQQHFNVIAARHVIVLATSSQGELYLILKLNQNTELVVKVAVIKAAVVRGAAYF